MLRMAWGVICLVMVAACTEPERVQGATTTAQPVAQMQAPELEPEHPSIDTPIDSTPEPVRQALLMEAIKKVATEYRADWMLRPTEGSSYLTGQIQSIYAKGKPGVTFYGLVKQASQNTREDFLNRAEVAKTSAEILYRAQMDAAQNRAINRLVREQTLLAERQQAAQQASFEAELQAQAQVQASYANTADARQYVQPEYREAAPRARPVNPSRFDPERVGFDSRKGYTSLQHSSRARSDDDAAGVGQSGPTRFQDQYGNWYEQPPGSGFARNENTGKQCFLNGTFVICK